MYHSVFDGGVRVIVLMCERGRWGSKPRRAKHAGDPAVAQPVEASTVATQACQEAAHRGRMAPQQVWAEDPAASLLGWRRQTRLAHRGKPAGEEASRAGTAEWAPTAAAIGNQGGENQEVAHTAPQTTSG
jgi:hypothetical protein